MTGAGCVWTLFTMHTIAARGRARRLSALLLAFALIAQLAIIAGAGAASALPCDPNTNPNCPPPPPSSTYQSTITVTPPDHGIVYGRAEGASTDAVVCSAADTSRCSVTDYEDGYTRPVSGWPSYTFAYSGSGFISSWGGACTGVGACTITNSAPTTTLTVSTWDAAPPQVTLNVPSRVGPYTTMTATATDNVAVARIQWLLCQTDGSGCTVVASGGPEATALTISNHASGDYRVVVQANDMGGNVGSAWTTISYVGGIGMTVQTLAPYTEAPSLSFHTDDEAHVPNDQAHRACRAFPTGTTPPTWGPCTTWTSFAPELADGQWTLQAQETDDLGLTALASQNTTVDTTAPTVTLTDGPSEGAVVATPTVDLGFTATDANLASVTCALDDATPVACTSPYALSGYAQGAHTFTVTATDELGHHTSAVRHFTAAVSTTLNAASTRVKTTYGHSAVLSATVSPATATGTVRFTTASGSTLCTGTVVSGRASCSTSTRLGAGSWAVTGTYRGGYLSSTTQLTLKVEQAATAISVRMPTTVRRGHRVTVTAYHLPTTATGTVTVTRSGHRLCSAKLIGGWATCTFTAALRYATYAIVTRYGGDRNYLAARRTVRMRVIH